MLEITEEIESAYIPTETQKVEKITKFIKEKVNEFRCEMQKKVEAIDGIITSLEYEKSNMIIQLNKARR